MKGLYIDNRRKLFLFNLKIKKYFFKVFRSALRHHIEQIEGFRVSFFDYSSLVFQYKEIFVNLEYHFRANKRDPFIIDCGSNVGVSILFFKSLYPESRIVGFEPDKSTFEKLEQNVRLNKLQDVQVLNKAVSDKNEEINFYYDPDVPGSEYMSTIRERMPKKSQKVASVMLSEYISSEVDFLKLDVEGSETAVICELFNKGKLGLIKQIVMEYHHHIKEGEDNLSQILGMLEESGFGYQIGGVLRRPFKRDLFQDITVYAYQKS